MKAIKPRLLLEGEYDRMHGVEDTHWWYVALHRLVLEALAKESLRSKKPLHILDVGCGTGRLSYLCHQAGYLIRGLDPSPRAITLAKKRLGGWHFVKGSATRLPFPKARFDAVLLMDVIYLLHPDQMAQAFAEARRVLKPGGLLLIHSATLPWLHSAHDIAVQTVRRYPLPEVRGAILQAGLTIERLTHRMGLLLPPVALSRFISRFTRRGPAPKGDVAPPSALGQAIGHALMALEARLLKYTDLPIGVSLWAVVRKAPKATHRPN